MPLIISLFAHLTVKTTINSLLLFVLSHDSYAFNLIYCPQRLLYEFIPIYTMLSKLSVLKHQLKLRWLEHLWDHGHLVWTWFVRATELLNSHPQDQEANGDILGISFSIFYDIMVHWVYSLKSHRWGDFIEYTQHTLYNKVRKFALQHT